MDLDGISKLFAQRRFSRRRAVHRGAAGLAAGGLGAVDAKASVAAQDAPPSADGSATPTATWDGEKIPYLFVQSFGGGAIAPKAGEDGAYTVTLDHGLGQTLYFADRPSRDVGATSTAQFLQTLGFPDDNPPNAALVTDDGNGGTQIAVVELRNPAYDEASHTANYDIAVLADWRDSTDLGLEEEPADLSALPTDLGPTHLFIDDCSGGTINCFRFYDVVASYSDQPFCYNYAMCIPCEPYGHSQPDRCSVGAYWKNKCTNDHPDLCNADNGGQCDADWPGRVFLGC